MLLQESQSGENIDFFNKYCKNIKLLIKWRDYNINFWSTVSVLDSIFYLKKY